MSKKLDLSKLLFHCEEELRNKTDELNRWGIEFIDDWSFDQSDGRLILTREDGTVFSGPAQIVGTLNEDLGTWMWGWANTSVGASLKADSLAVKAYGETHGVKSLTKPVQEMYDSDALQHAALAAHLSSAWGVYRGAANLSRTSLLASILPQETVGDGENETAVPDVYFTFRDLIMTHPDRREERLAFRPDPVYTLQEGQPVDDRGVAGIVQDYAREIADWARRRFEDGDKVDRDELDHDEAKAIGLRERRAIFDRFCSPGRGRVMTRLAYGSDEVPEEVVRMVRFADGTVTAVTKKSDPRSNDMTAYRLREEEGRYLIYKKYRVYDDGSRKLSYGDDDL